MAINNWIKKWSFNPHTVNPSVSLPSSPRRVLCPTCEVIWTAEFWWSDFPLSFSWVLSSSVQVAKAQRRDCLTYKQNKVISCDFERGQSELKVCGKGPLPGLSSHHVPQQMLMNSQPSRINHLSRPLLPKNCLTMVFDFNIWILGEHKHTAICTRLFQRLTHFPECMNYSIVLQTEPQTSCLAHNSRTFQGLLSCSALVTVLESKRHVDFWYLWLEGRLTSEIRERVFHSKLIKQPDHNEYSESLLVMTDVFCLPTLS